MLFCVVETSSQFGLSFGVHSHTLKARHVKICAVICYPALPRYVDSVPTTCQADCRAKVGQIKVCHDSLRNPTRGSTRQQPIGEVIYDGAHRSCSEEKGPMPLKADSSQRRGFGSGEEEGYLGTWAPGCSLSS